MIVNGIEYRHAIGVPYAHVRVQGRRLYKVCPRCGTYILNVKRKDAESYSGVEYAEHYNQLHAYDDGRILVDGVWYEPATP